MNNDLLDGSSAAAADAGAPRAEANPGARLGGIRYWVFNYMPKWEAASSEIELLARTFRERHGTRILSLNLGAARVQLRGRDKHVPLPLALFGAPWIGRIAASIGVNHVFASPSERFLTPRLARGGTTILTIGKDSPDLHRLERSMRWMRSLHRVVVESERHLDLLVQAGLAEDRIELIYPGVEQRPYRAASPPFTILFATSPRESHDFIARGIQMMIAVARLLPSVTFLLVWRDRHYGKLMRLIEEAGVSNVRVINGYVEDMEAIYDSVHATILPALCYTSLKPCPHSALDSLAHGKPLLVSRPVSLARIVEETRCGIVFEPDVRSLRNAVVELMERYCDYQVNAHDAASARFSRSVFLERYGRIYDAIAAGGAS